MMENKIKEKYQDNLKEQLGSEIYKGLKELSKVEPCLNVIFQPSPDNNLAKKIAASLLIIIDNRNKILKKVVELTNLKI